MIKILSAIFAPPMIAVYGRSGLPSTLSALVNSDSIRYPATF